MDLRDLRAFVHVAQLQSFSRAAAQLRVAQSAVSRRVQRLEHQLGVTLLDRHARGIHLTEFGALLLDKAEDIFAGLRQIETDMMSIAKEPTGHIRIAFPPATGQILAPILIENFGRRFPRVTLHVMEGFTSSIQDWLIRGVVDLAILYNPEHSPDVSVTRLLTEPLFLIVPISADRPRQPIEDASEVRFRDLAGLPLILPSRTHSVRLLLDRNATNYGVKLSIVHEVDGMNIIKRLVERGMGYTVFNYAGVYEEVERGSLKVIPITQPTITWQLALVGRNQQHASRAMADLKGLIEAEVRRLVGMGFWRSAPTEEGKTAARAKPKLVQPAAPPGRATRLPPAAQAKPRVTVAR